MVASGVTEYGYRYHCAACNQKGTPTTYTSYADYFKHYEETKITENTPHGAWWAAWEPISYTEAKYDWVDKTVITANAYDTWYYLYTCLDCGATMVGKVVGTYDGEANTHENYETKVLSFIYSGELPGKIINAAGTDVTESKYACETITPGTEYSFTWWN